MIQLTKEQREQLHALMLLAFSLAELKILVRLKLGWTLEEEVNVAPAFREVLLSAITVAEKRGETGTLIRAIVQARPQRDDLQTFCRDNFAAELAAQPAAALIGSVTSSIQAVVDVLADPEIRVLVGTFRADFETIQERIRILAGYKELHQVLHTLQKQLPAIRDAIRRSETDPSSRRLLARQVVELESQVASASRSTTGLPTALIEQQWIDDFRAAVTAATDAQAAGAAGLQRLPAVADELTQLLQDLARIDGQMVVTLAGLPLHKLIQALQEIGAHLANGAAGAQLVGEQLGIGVGALSIIRPRLSGLVAEHNEWQRLDRDLAGIESNPGYRPTEKIPRWQRVKERLLALCDACQAEEWAQRISTNIGQWETAATGNDNLACDLAADSLRGRSMNRFFDVDDEVLDLCNRLTELAQPLGTLLKAYTNGHA